jgi:hypothetical protein
MGAGVMSTFSVLADTSTGTWRLYNGPTGRVLPTVFTTREAADTRCAERNDLEARCEAVAAMGDAEIMSLDEARIARAERRS